MSGKLVDIAETLIAEQRSLITKGFGDVDISSLVEVATCLLDSPEALILFTGVGKSGFVAQKLSTTFVSCGMRSVFLSPLDALHGDLGIVSRGDFVIALSRSGQTDELLHLMPFLERRGAKIIAITCEDQSSLAQRAHCHISIPLKKEASTYSMIPTTSTALQLLVGDLLALILMESKRVPLEHFASNHPGGRIGKRLLMRVEDCMLQGEALPLVAPETAIQEVLVTISEKQCGCVLATSAQGTLEGIFTDGDLRRALQKEGCSLLKDQLSQLMTTTPAAVAPNVLAYDALKQMQSHLPTPITCLPVINPQRSVVGLLRMVDLIKLGL